jgi:4-amino-4-deoxy-L-arabinose transferase-like glycosyltransferase
MSLRRPSGATLALVAILVVAAVVRGLWVAFVTRDPVGTFDPAVYFAAADDISEGRGYNTATGAGGGLRFQMLPAEPTAYFPPAFPFALSAVFWLVRHTPLPDDLPRIATAFNAALGVGAVALVYALGRRLLSVGVGLAAAAIVALWPNLVFHTGTIFSETLFIVLMLGALLVVAWRPWPEGRLSTSRLAAFGGLLGLAALTRPPALALLIAFALAVWAGGVGWRRALVQTGIVLLAVVVVVLPWTIRNAVQMDAPVAISTNLGDNLCIGHNPDATGAFQLSRFCGGPRASTPRREEILRNRANIKEALDFAVDHPVRELELIGLRAKFMVVGDHDAIEAVEYYGTDRFIAPGLRSALVTAADAWYYVMLALALIGVPSFVAGRDPRRLMVLFSLLALLLAPLLFFGGPRYHVPAMPLVALLAGVTLVRLAELARRKREPQVAL